MDCLHVTVDGLPQYADGFKDTNSSFKLDENSHPCSPLNILGCLRWKCSIPWICPSTVGDPLQIEHFTLSRRDNGRSPRRWRQSTRPRSRSWSRSTSASRLGKAHSASITLSLGRDVGCRDAATENVAPSSKCIPK